MADLLLHNGIVIALDADRRILTDTSVAIIGQKIVEVGPAAALKAKYAASTLIDCTRKAILPGMVDLHGYLSGSIIKSIGESLNAVARRDAVERIITGEIDEEWWEVESQLCALERLKMGVTCMHSMMGGNGTRTDDVVFVQISDRELNRVGLRTRIGVGPSRPPWPQSFAIWRGGKKIERMVEFDEVIANCDRLLAAKQKDKSGIVDYGLALSRIGNKNDHDPVWSPDKEKWISRQAEAMRDLLGRYGVGFFTHVYGNAIDYAYDEKLGLLGPRSIMSHCTGISARSLDILKETGSHVGHHPRAARYYSFPGHCPLPEMIDRGINVGLGADTPANHDCDIFMDMKAAIAIQRIEHRDGKLIPPGKALEMATIDGCRALGLDGALGSIEPGKTADLITVDLYQPHLAPIDMPVHRLVYQATGRDVNDVVVNGRLVMRDRKILTIDEHAVLDRAQEMYRRIVERAGLAAQAKPAGGFWGVSRSS